MVKFNKQGTVYQIDSLGSGVEQGLGLNERGQPIQVPHFREEEKEHVQDDRNAEAFILRHLNVRTEEDLEALILTDQMAPLYKENELEEADIYFASNPVREGGQLISQPGASYSNCHYNPACERDREDNWQAMNPGQRKRQFGKKKMEASFLDKYAHANDAQIHKDY